MAPNPNKSSSGDLNGAFFGPSIPPSRTNRSLAGRASGCCNPCSCLLCSLFKLLFSIVITLGIIFFILWLVFRPNELKLSVDDARLAAFDLNSSSSSLSYNLSLSLSVRNPNRRISIYYDQIEAIALYDGSRFGYDGSIPAFFQGHKNTTVISPRFAGREKLILGAVNGTYVREKGEGFFFVDVRLNAWIRLKVMFVKLGHFKPRFYCRIKLPVPPASGGSPAAKFERTECDVDWI